MSSSRTLDFRLRPNKGIERSIAFDVLERVRPFLGESPIYVGLGSLWFIDFRMAHRQLGIQTMVSIEADKAIASRARFNSPYQTIEVVEGFTTEEVPKLLDREDFAERPWVVWLDYDAALNAGRVNELSQLIKQLPDGSALLTTFNAAPGRYGSHDLRVETISDLFGADIVGSNVTSDDVVKAKFGPVLEGCVSRFLEAAARRAGREGGFVTTTSLRYSDSAEMITIGGVLPSKGNAKACRELVDSSDWIGVEETQIESQPLTPREVDALCTLLPSDTKLVVDDVANLGFEIDQAQLDFFQRHYLRYPSYAEIIT